MPACKASWWCDDQPSFSKLQGRLGLQPAEENYKNGYFDDTTVYEAKNYEDQTVENAVAKIVNFPAMIDIFSFFPFYAHSCSPI